MKTIRVLLQLKDDGELTNYDIENRTDRELDYCVNDDGELIIKEPDDADKPSDDLDEWIEIARFQKWYGVEIIDLP